MRYLAVVLGVGNVALIIAGCGSHTTARPYESGAGATASGGTTGASQGGSSAALGGALTLLVDGGLGAGAATDTDDPQTCAEAAAEHSYVGCDFWPTVVANNVWSIFDFAVVVANAGTTAASVTVTGPSNTNQSASVPPGQLVKLFLPWVPALKGPDADSCGSSVPLSASALVAAGAFHLVATAPVTVYQFNALEYQGKGGPAGKNWQSCPGLLTCTQGQNRGQIGCYSFSNDASLLLPSTAMTGNYRVAGHGGILLTDPQSMQPGGGVPTEPNGGYMAITGTADGTTVKVQVSSLGEVVAGPGVAATTAGNTLTLALNAGDVAELLGTGPSDLSGSIIQASAPVQLITGHPCAQIPPTSAACDHLEESVFPAETLGKNYVVTMPTGPSGAAVAHQVRFYGNFDNTQLTYNPPTPPPGCPVTLSAGQVVECGVGGPCPSTVDVNQSYDCGTISQDFEVTGDRAFAVGTFTLGASIVDPNPARGTPAKGDPAESFATAVEQYRTSYVFLAPDDYVVSYVDIVATPSTTLTLDGQTVTTSSQPIGSTGFGIYRVELGGGQAGAHVLRASEPVGTQIIGYGDYTSYMYPGGSNLGHIAAPPVIK
ncbi:MAG: IgGFc-binding protein [Polyangiaceae bacterium]